MQQWEAKQLTEFKLDKCEVITITNKRSHINYPYNIHGKQLVHVQHTKYLEPTFSNNLSWNKHIDNITKKANATCAFLSRNIQLFEASKGTMLHNAPLSLLIKCCNRMGSLHQIQHKQIRKIPTPCCQICEWGLLKRKQYYIYVKGTKMVNKEERTQKW